MTACGLQHPPQVVTETQIVQDWVPETLLSCADEPPLPSPEDDDFAYGRFVAQLGFSGRDCRSQLREVRERQARLQKTP